MTINSQKQEITQAVAARIKILRVSRSMSQEDLALRAEINPAYFGQVERGLKCPTVDTLYKISKALEIPLSEIFRQDTLPVSVLPESQRLQELMSRVPEEKREQMLRIIEALIPLI